MLPPTSWAIQTGIARTRGSAHGMRRRSRPLNTPCSAAPLVNTPGGPFSRPWTSSPPGMTPPQLRCLLHRPGHPHCLPSGLHPPGRYKHHNSAPLFSLILCSLGFGVSYIHRPHRSYSYVSFASFFFFSWCTVRFCSLMVSVRFLFL